MKNIDRKKIREDMSNHYLEELAALDFPVIKQTVLTTEEFNNELEAAIIDGQKRTEDGGKHYLEELENLDFPVVKETVMSLEEFNQELRTGIVGEDETSEAAKSVSEEKISKLARVS